MNRSNGHATGGDGLPRISGLSPIAGEAGTLVAIAGINFINITGVTFNTVAASSYVVNSDTSITATVPASCGTGPLDVVSSGGRARWDSFSEVSGGTSMIVTAIKTANYTAAIAESVRCDPSGGAFTVTLPSAVGIAGQKIEVKNVTDSENAITVDANGSQTIDGSLTRTLDTPRACETYESDGANWMLV